MAGFNGSFFGSENATFFGLKKGFNSAFFTAEKATFFGLKKGFNGLALSADISIGRLFLLGNLYTGATSVTISSTQGSYLVNAVDGYFPVYPWYSDPSTITQVIVEADAGVYYGEVTVTPSTPQFIDIDLELVAGMAVKTTGAVILPDPTSQTAGQAADTDCKCAAQYVETVVTDGGIVDDRNDKSSFLFQRFAPSDTVAFELWKAGSKVADITDSSYGDYYDFGDLGNINYKGVVLDWKLINGSFGYGLYQFKAVQSLLGTASTFESRHFQLLPYSCESVEGTVRIESYQTGNIISSPFDYTDLIDGGWYSSYRINGWFGRREINIEQDNYITSDYIKSQIQDKLITSFTLETKILPASIINAINYDSMLGNRILISDYNSLNSEALTRIDCLPVSIENKQLAGGRLSYNIKLEERKQDTIKRNF